MTKDEIINEISTYIRSEEAKKVLLRVVDDYFDGMVVNNRYIFNKSLFLRPGANIEFNSTTFGQEGSRIGFFGTSPIERLTLNDVDTDYEDNDGNFELAEAENGLRRNGNKINEIIQVLADYGIITNND